MSVQNVSRSVLVAALVAIASLATAAVLFVSGDDSMQRLAILVGFLAPISVGLVAAVRSDAAAKSTDQTSSIAQALNGGFDARVRNANRDTASETGSTEDAMRAAADAETAAALAAHPAPDPPVTPNPITPTATPLDNAP